LRKRSVAKVISDIESRHAGRSEEAGRLSDIDGPRDLGERREAMALTQVRHTLGVPVLACVNCGQEMCHEVYGTR
jgi:exosome complex RNA-binding protein Csl4